MKKLISLLLFIAIGFLSIGSFVNAEDNTYEYLNKSIIEKLDKKIDSIKGNKTRSLILLIGKVDKIIKIETNEIKKALYTELNVYLKLKKRSFEVKVVDETANWKTYKNDKYGFEFKYPSNIKFVDIVEEKTGKGNNIRFIVDTTSEKWGNGDGKFDIYVVSIVPKDSLSQEYSERGIEFDLKKIKNGNYYQFSGPQDVPEDWISKNIKFNDVILSFKFTEADETADWKTYKNDNYGFEFKYQSNIKFVDIVEEKSGKGNNIRFFVDTTSEKRGNGDGKFDIFVVSIVSKDSLLKEYSERGIEFDLKKIKNGNYYQFSGPQDIPEDWISKNVKFNETLSTFKFTE